MLTSAVTDVMMLDALPLASPMAAIIEIAHELDCCKPKCWDREGLSVDFAMDSVGGCYIWHADFANPGRTPLDYQRYASAGKKWPV